MQTLRFKPGSVSLGAFHLTGPQQPVKQGAVSGTPPMQTPFIVLVRPVGAANLQLHAAAAPDALLAMAAVSQSLRDSERADDLVVGVFRRADWEVMGQLFDGLEAMMARPSMKEASTARAEV